MMQELDILDRLLQKDQADDMISVITEFAHHLGFRAFALGILNVLSELSGKFISTYNAEYLAIYQKKKFYLHDHVIAHCIKCDTPINWETTYPFETLSPQAQKIILTSADFGIIQGVAVPVETRFGRGIVSLQFDGSSKELDDYMQHRLFKIMGFCQATLWKATRDAPSLLLEQPRLTKREYECLHYMGDGLSNYDISQVMGISLSRVKELVSALFRKLHAANRVEAVMQAVNFHII
ncbi:MAG: LuxR family transcriptional regulator [Pseudomonadota bacterium]